VPASPKPRWRDTHSATHTRAREFRKAPTAAESKLWESLRRKAVGELRFRNEQVLSDLAGVLAEIQSHLQ